MNFHTRSFIQLCQKIFQSQTLTQYSFYFLVLLALAFSFWRCQYGLELYDEPFYLVPGFKLYALGDRPITHEVHNGFRQFDILNHLLVRPFVDYSLLSIRRAAVGFYATCLLFFFLICFRFRPGVLAGLLFAVCLLFDPFQMPTWSHNWWCRNFLLVHHGLLLLAFRYLQNKRKLAHIAWFLAGGVFGGVGIAYNPLALLFPVMVLFLYFARLKISLLSYVLGWVVVIAAQLIYLLSVDWMGAIHTMLSDYSDQQSYLQRALSVVSYLARAVETWLGVGIGLGIIFQKRKISVLFCGLLGLFLLKRTFGAQYFFMTQSLFICLGAISALLFLFWSLRTKNSLYAFLVLCSISSAFLMALVSANGVRALFWMVPSVLALFFSYVLSIRSVRWVSTFYLLVLLYGTVHFMLGHAYFDVPPKQCTVRLEMSPLEGIYTSPKRANLLGHINRLTKSSQYTFALGIPGAYYFHQSRSSTNSTILNNEFPSNINSAALTFQHQSHRVPDLILRAKVHPWNWGLVVDEWKTFSGTPYEQFVRCARRDLLYSVDEFEAFSVKAGASQCTQQII